MVYGLYKKIFIKKERLFKNPNTLHKPGPIPEDFNSSFDLEKFVCANIPIGHRFIFNDPNFAKAIYSAVANLMLDKKIQPRQIPLCHNLWTHKELNDLLK